MDTPSLENEACCEGEPDWIMDAFRSEAILEQQKKESEEMSGLVYLPPTSLLRDAMCSAIAEALDIDD